MTGATAIRSPTGVVASADIFNGQTPSHSLTNSQRIAYVADRMFMALDSSGRNSHPMDLFHLCLALARGIDYAVANNDVPPKAQELPILLKKVCQRRNDHVLQAAIMVLMISVKIACKLEWFKNNDIKELLTLANEIGSTFCSQGNINSEPSNSLPTVLNVMAKFCPQMKTSQIFASFEVNPGYGAYLVDFHISKNQTFSPKDKIRLFVAQTDCLETSSCLISPPQVSFLLNGKGVEKRSNVFMEARPQIPTDVTSMLKYGTNLLQVVGQFNGHYLIVISSMNLTSIPETPVLPDYVQPAVAAQDADAEIIEGRSRISLNCPISCKRIKTPAKGQSCKHIQSFDLDNFLKLNTRTLSWRCPHCGQNTCYLDIRIDQYMVKVLREVGENFADVIIFEDGSWKAGSEYDHVDQPSDKTLSSHQDGPEPQETTRFSDTLPLVFDLTDGDYEADLMSISEIVDKKPFQANPQSHSIDAILHKQSEMNNVSQTINEGSTPQIVDDFWSGIFLSTHSSVTSSPRSDAQNVGGIAQPSLASNMISPMLNNVVPPALNREPEELHGNTTSIWQSQFSAPNTLQLQLQQSQLEHSIMSNEYGSFSSIPRHVTRTPIAIQALPAQSQQSVPQHRTRTSLNSLTPNGSSVIPTGEGFDTISIDNEGQQQFSRNLTSPMQVSEMASSSLQHRSMAQNWDHQDGLFIPSRSVQQVVGLPAPSRLPGPYRQSSGVLTEHQYSPQQLAVNQIMPQNFSQPPNLMNRTPPHLQRTRMEQLGTQAGEGRTAVSANPPFMAASQRAIHMNRQSQYSPVQIQMTRTGASPTVNKNGLRGSVGEQRENRGGTVQPVTTVEDLLDISFERNWQPTGRMRGSLSGQAYSAALSQFMTPPARPSQATRPPANPTSLPSGAPPQLQVLLANNRNAHVSQTHSTDEADIMINSLDVLPDQSS